MNVFTGKQIDELFNGREGSAVATYLVKQGYGKRRIDVAYDDMPPQVYDVAKLWKNIKRRSVQDPSSPDKILQKIAQSALAGESLWLFSPWGPRYKKKTARIAQDDPEMRTLGDMRSVAEMFRNDGCAVSVLLMPADVYGTEINRLSAPFVREYFSYLEDAARQRFDGMPLTVVPWSALRDENRMRYDELASCIDRDWARWVPDRAYQAAIAAARFFNPANAAQSARQYCRERLIEGCIIAEQYDPVKISLVRKAKDTLDATPETVARTTGNRGLQKILYIIPEENRAPWLRGDE